MLPLFKVYMNPDVDTPLLETLHSGHITEGKKVEEFEDALRDWFDHPYVLTLNSATSALTLALRLMDLSPGDEVLSTPLTCTATNWPILANGARIRWVDVDPKTCNMDLDRLQESIGPRTKAIVFVNWGGNPLNLAKLELILDRAEAKYGHRIAVLEDCAHAFGRVYDGIHVGTGFGHYSVFSFQAIKQLTTVDGGCLLLPNLKQYERAKRLRWFGIDRDRRSLPGKDFRLEEDIPEWGYKFHMNDVNATIGLSNIQHVENLLSIARNNGKYYESNLANVPGVELLTVEPEARPAWWIYTLKVADKESFISHMTDAGIMVSQVHRRNDNHSCVAESKVSLPQLDVLEKHIISIPVGWWVSSSDRERVVLEIKEWSRRHVASLKEGTELGSDTPSGVTVRLLDKQDGPGYLALMKEFGAPMPKVSWGKTLKRLRATGKPVVVERDGAILGAGTLVLENKLRGVLGHIEDVVVLSVHRRCGYGSIIVQELLRRSQERSAYKVVLNCSDEVAPFYQRHGFVRNGYGMEWKP